MLPHRHAGFELDRRLEAMSRPLMWLGLCELRIVDDRRWPWLLLVPQRPGILDAHDMTPLDQAMLTFEVNMVAPVLKRVAGCHTVNVASIGNEIEQLHVHLIARSPGDAGWPGTVWDCGPAIAWNRAEMHGFIDRLRSAL